MKKRILFVIPSLGVGGTNSALNSIYNAIKEQYDISVFCISHVGQSKVSFKEVLLDEKWFLTAFFGNFRDLKKSIPAKAVLIKLLRRFCTLIHIPIDKIVYKYWAVALDNLLYDDVIAFQEGYATHLVSNMKHKNKIAWIHCDYSRLTHADGKESIYASFKKIICVSQYTAKVFTDIYPTLLNRTDYIYNILDQEYINKKALEQIEDKRFSTNMFTIISLGRVDPIKRFSIIPSVAKQLQDKNICFTWYILGPDVGNDEIRLLKSKINMYGLGNVVKWLGNKPNPYPYIKASNLLVTLSISEACPMIFNEARVLGIPIISTDFGSAFEFIHSNKNGIICPIEDMVNQIACMITDKDKYNRIKKNISEFSFSNDEILSKIKHIF